MKPCVRFATLLLLVLTSAETLGADELSPEQWEQLKAKAVSLNQLGVKHYEDGKDAEATELLMHALELWKKVYPPQRYPDGHPNLATALKNLAELHRAQGDYGRAEPLCHEALHMARKLCFLYPPRRPTDYLILATNFHDLAALLTSSLDNLAALHEAQGEYAKAEPLFREAHDLRRKLYPPQRYPDGHPHLSRSLSSLAALHQAQGEYAKAEPLFREALGMARKLYPAALYPDGHHKLAGNLSNLAHLHTRQGEYAKAEPLYREALDTWRKLYPPQHYPEGHPYLATTLNNLAQLHRSQGEFGKAEQLFSEALDMWRKLYPPQRYPKGHRNLATTLNNLGYVHQSQGEYGKATSLFGESLRMYRDQMAALVGTRAEVEALNLAAILPNAEHGLLGASVYIQTPAADLYPLLWRGKGSVAQLLQRREQALTLTADPQALQLAEQLRLVRQRLSAALLSSRTPERSSSGDLSRLSEEKESLERRLAARLPVLQRHRDLDQLDPGDLIQRLPDHAAFLDVYRYVHRSKGATIQWRYAVFVLTRSQPIQRVEIEDATAIDLAWSAWHRGITRGQDDTAAAATLRKHLWQPLAAVLPAGTRQVYVAPEGPLTGVPWGALPGDEPRSVLLEKYAFAVILSATFLLDRFTPDPQRMAATPSLTAIGDVDYTQPPQPALDQPAEGVVSRGAMPPLEKTFSWPPLPGTAVEQRLVADLARRALGVEPISRSGAQASVAQVLRDLGGSRFAHLATHGFFADAQFRSILQLDEKEFARGPTEHRVTPGRRNPLTLSGLVLAGANRSTLEGDRGLLTAEMIASQPLEKLHLAVLSACDTGLGESGGGEGVFGLQRAFHLAGCANVIASLWKVDDEATAALMGLFYRYLWVEKREPLEALRQAQLYLYRNPDQIPELAKERGFAFGVPLPKETPKSAAGIPAKRAPVKQWAAFVLSGTGR